MSEPLRKHPPRRTAVIVPLLIGAVCCASAAAWFAPRLYRTWKHEHLLRQAKTFLEASDMRNAAICLRKALLSDPSSVEAAQLMARLAEAGGSREAVNWRARLVELEPTNH